LLPTEALHVEVSLERRRLALFIGDWFVKDWPAGVGRDDKPTPYGTFEVGKNRSRNPDWWSPDGFIPYGDPRNELGSMWIGIESDRVPEDAGIGLHGTNKAQSVGTRCSNGCVRLENDDALELYGWVRGKDSNGGEPTRIVIFDYD
jgi:lipoprotein-anchoring transpeptidase ErfK/SrfK